jgi:hypothetical protein
MDRARILSGTIFTKMGQMNSFSLKKSTYTHIQKVNLNDALKIFNFFLIKHEKSEFNLFETILFMVTILDLNTELNVKRLDTKS